MLEFDPINRPDFIELFREGLEVKMIPQHIWVEEQQAQKSLQNPELEKENAYLKEENSGLRAENARLVQELAALKKENFKNIEF